MTASHAPEMSEVLSGQHKVVVLAPHPDDESLGCGALLARAFTGAGARVICITDGSASHPNSSEWPPERLAECRRAELIDAIACMGGAAEDMTWMGLPDAKLYQIDPAEIANDLQAIIKTCGAQHIFVPAAEDHHEDHKVVVEAARVLRRLRPDWSFYSYPVWCRWDDANFECEVMRHAPAFIEAGAWAASKRAAIMSHRSQMGEVVRDDPLGFVLPAELVEKFVNGDEIFWRMP